MTEEKHECKTYAEMLAVLREAKEAGHTAWWNSEEPRNGELIVYVGKDGRENRWINLYSRQVDVSNAQKASGYERRIFAVIKS